jgi:hypothetical protein
MAYTDCTDLANNTHFQARVQAAIADVCVAAVTNSATASGPRSAAQRFMDELGRGVGQTGTPSDISPVAVTVSRNVVGIAAVAAAAAGYAGATPQGSNLSDAALRSAVTDVLLAFVR